MPTQQEIHPRHKMFSEECSSFSTTSRCLLAERKTSPGEGEGAASPPAGPSTSLCSCMVWQALQVNFDRTCPSCYSHSLR